MKIKAYKMPDGREVMFHYDRNGVGKITLESVDMLMGELIAYQQCIQSRSFWDAKHCDGCIFYDDCPFNPREDEDEPNCSEKPNNCANCKHLKKHNGKLADYVCDRKGSIVTNPYDKECDEMWEPKTEPNVSEIPTGSESQTEVDWKKRLCDMYGADRKSFDEAWEKYEADKVNTEPQTETSTFSEKVQLTEVTQTERSSE